MSQAPGAGGDPAVNSVRGGIFMVGRFWAEFKVLREFTFVRCFPQLRASWHSQFPASLIAPKLQTQAPLLLAAVTVHSPLGQRDGRVRPDKGASPGGFRGAAGPRWVIKTRRKKQMPLTLLLTARTTGQTSARWWSAHLRNAIPAWWACRAWKRRAWGGLMTFAPCKASGGETRTILRYEILHCHLKPSSSCSNGVTDAQLTVQRGLRRCSLERASALEPHGICLPPAVCSRVHYYPLWASVSWIMKTGLYYYYFLYTTWWWGLNGIVSNTQHSHACTVSCRDTWRCFWSETLVGVDTGMIGAEGGVELALNTQLSPGTCPDPYFPNCIKCLTAGELGWPSCLFTHTQAFSMSFLGLKP